MNASLMTIFLLVALQTLFFFQPSYCLSDSHKHEGYFNKIQDAINAIPNNNIDLVLIRVMPGIYREQVIIPVDKPYIILSGYNANNTVITWNDNAEASGTYSCATLTIFASDFVARYITIENSYEEPNGNPIAAVAIRVSGDRSAFYNCRFLGYQDTVLDDSGRHYFKNCFIQGGVDFICGNGQSLYEKCHLHTIPRQNGAIAAQRRNASGEATGFVFLNCKVTGGGLMYLGRAWGYYSRVIFAFTYMDDIIFPEGWNDWNDPTRQKLVIFGQYKCFGPGSNIEKRVSWAYNELSDDEAAPFITISFVNGERWIHRTPIPPALKKEKNHF
ncbi:hypothetical protein SUGI_0798620 [Cryptomeria japonica]|nr:hypothetical protein SUGI_0798620 [Cryptomeria japonica]